MADLLKKGMRGPSHINLIMLNKVTETGFEAPDRKGAERFRTLLEGLGMNATIRRRLGSDIDASCGQLRSKHVREKKEKEGEQ